MVSYLAAKRSFVCLRVLSGGPCGVVCSGGGKDRWARGVVVNDKVHESIFFLLDYRAF
jgi:hypothetical protein